MHYSQHIVHGALLVLFAELCMATMGALIKQLGQDLPNEVLVFARNLAGLLLLLPLLLQFERFTLRTSVLRLHIFRSVAGVGAMYCFFYALIHLPLAEGMLLKMTAPLFMPVIAIYWLGERISSYSKWALLIGFFGVLVVLRPGGEFNWIMLIGVAGGALAALAKVSIRRLSRTEPTYRIVFYFALVGLMISLLPLLFRLHLETVEIPANSWWLIAAVGVVGTVGQFALTRGYAIANAGTIAPLTYFSVVFGALYGYLFWQEIPAYGFFIGALMIAFAGLLTVKKTTPVVL